MQVKILMKLFFLLFFFLIGLYPVPWSLTPSLYALEVDDVYNKARNNFIRLRGKREVSCEQWLKCIKEFEGIFLRYPGHEKADDALYNAARSYYLLYQSEKGEKVDKNQAEDYLTKSISLYRELANRYKESNLADDALYKVAMIYEEDKIDPILAYREYSATIQRFPQGDMASIARERLVKLRKANPALDEEVVNRYRTTSKKKRVVKNVRHWSNPEYTRVVIDLSGETEYWDHLLRADKSLGKPPRLIIDVYNSITGEDINLTTPVEDSLLSRIRIGQYTKTTVRVVLDLKSLVAYDPMQLVEPARIVIDVHGEPREGEKKVKKVKAGTKGEKAGDLRRQMGLKIQRVMVDAGHGGRDPGAVGPGGIREKDLVLYISKKLKREIERELGLNVIMTRESDVFLSLDKRTALANTKGADIFISVHTNANPSPKARGVSTYSLNFTYDKEARRVAARENAMSERRLSDLEIILRDLMHTQWINQSARLASQVQAGMVKSLRGKYSDISDLGSKQAPFYVLIGAKMPAVLVETSFITNRKECRRLQDAGYQSLLAKGIVEGIRLFISEISDQDLVRAAGE